MIREMIDMPPEMARLPVDARGYPVPEFVHWMDGIPDFRILKTGWREECYKNKRCWLCGGFMGKRKWFVIGPMCSVTRTTMEPPCHRLCAEFAVKNCPFLTKPLAKRNERDMPDESFIDGISIARNPGVTIVWETESYKPFNVKTGHPEKGWLITVGPPRNVSAWREGRHASREELWQSVETGLPLLYAEAEKEGLEAVQEFLKTIEEWKVEIFDRYFPEQNQRKGQRL